MKAVEKAIPSKKTEKQPASSFYTENDSDNESDFDVKYEQVEDTFDDVK